MRVTGPIVPRVEVRPRKPLWEDGLMTLDESIQGMRLQVIRRAAVVGVSAACREAGISRTLFYRWQQRLSRYGVDGLHPRRLHAQPGPAPQLPPAAERRLLAVAIAEATWGAARLASYAQRLWRLRVAPSTVQRLLRRHGLATRRQRLLGLEHHRATQAGMLTARQPQVPWPAPPGRRQTRIKTRHAWTNGFVERLQQTILTEHWRLVFRRHYFTSRAALDRSLRGFVQFYNFDRPHHGYRVRGRTPATIFHGAVAAAR